MTSLTTTTKTTPGGTITSKFAERDQRGPGFGNILAAEWVKFSSLRSNWVTLGLGIVLALGMAVLRDTAIGGTWDPANPMYADFDPMTWPLDATIITTIAFSVLGVCVAAGEYTSGMIRLTFMTAPRRGSVLAAKAVIIAAVTVVTGIVSAAGMFLIGQLIYSSYGMPTASVSDPDAVRVVLEMGALAAVFPLIGLALGVLLRSTVGGITTVLALAFVPDLFGGLFPKWWQENVISLFPSQAIRAVAIGPLKPDDPRYQDPLVGAIIVAAWTGVALLGAYVLLRRRDA